MTIFLQTLKAQHFLDNIHITIAQIGSRKISGADDYSSQSWGIFAPNLTIYGFEADADECKRMNQNLKERNIRHQEKHIPIALSNTQGKSQLYVTKDKACSSLYEPNHSYVSRFRSSLPEFLTLDYVSEIETTTLDSFCASELIDTIDFLQVDVQGAELNIFQGAQQIIKNSTLAIQTEVEFAPIYKNQPLFADVDNHLRQQGFFLQGFKGLHCISKKSFPVEIKAGVPQYLAAQMLWGDAFYFQDLIGQSSPVSPEKLLKQACIADILYFPDYALELLEYLTVNYGSNPQYNFTEVINIGLSILKGNTSNNMAELTIPQPNIPNQGSAAQHKLKIGYVSPDFKRHPVGKFIAPIIKHHDRQKFEIYCYGEIRKVDEITEEIQSSCDHWRSTLGLTDAEVIEQIKQDQIDILIDLAGHTEDNRLPIFFSKPAPIQASYLGYFATTGIPTIDYWITDHHLHPVDTEEKTSETIWRLPRCYVAYQPSPEALEVNPLPALSSEYITFGCLNNFSKLNPFLLSLWAKILQALPQSRLILKSHYHNLDDTEEKQSVELFLQEQGLNLEQVELIDSPTLAEDYFALYHRIDIHLDTFPYNGCTTTCDALWMGVPVLTLAGDRKIQRMGNSLLQAIGLGDWIAHSPEEYVNKAITFAQDLEAIASLRTSLRERFQHSELGDIQGLTLALEACFQSLVNSTLAAQVDRFEDEFDNPHENLNKIALPIPPKITSAISDTSIIDLLKKARADDFSARFREIISDPLNLVIKRDTRAGIVDGNFVYLHNGIKVPFKGQDAYYGDFSSILVMNRGVHEPLEEFVFQQVLKRLSVAPNMLELGAYWGHYSMWLKILHPNATVILVEPESQNIKVGKKNFKLNGIEGQFLQNFVGKGYFSVDKYLRDNYIKKLSILHSDIQGYEVEMLSDCSFSLSNANIDYLFISTHSQDLHYEVIQKLKHFSYRVEVSSDFDQTTSYDGFIFASSPLVSPVFTNFTPMSRLEIIKSSPENLIDYLNALRNVETQSPLNYYSQYVQKNCPQMTSEDCDQLLAFADNTNWNQPTTLREWNNVAVIMLIEAEETQDIAFRKQLLNNAIAVLEQGKAHPLAAVHLALIYSLIGDYSKAYVLAYSVFVGILDPAFRKTASNKGLVYLPSTARTLLNKAEYLEKILAAENCYEQILFLCAEVLNLSQPYFYNASGQDTLQLISQSLATSPIVQLQLGIARFCGQKWDGIFYLLKAHQINPNYAPSIQALYLAYRNLPEAKAAEYWLQQGVTHFNPNSPDVGEWIWTQARPENPFTYVPYDNLILTVEANLKSITTAVLLAQGDWFEAEMELWRTQIRPDMTVIDVGANVGVYTFSAAQRVGETGKVIAIEPFKACVNCLQETSRINQLPWVKIYEAAASDHCGSAKLSLHNASELNEVISDNSPNYDLANTVTIQCLTLDSLIETENLTRVDWLKIDAEGHEIKVLQGAERLLTEFKPNIIYENIAGAHGSNGAIMEYIQAKGYQVYSYRPYIQELVPVTDANQLNSQLNLIAVYNPNK
ncbi:MULTISPECIES: FkbM family methyltransferase [unclassified Microcystis]|uniref:FkbM family methyltransferase n=1 Tax=unclassified Microcystis TaxID=2643300 RepID=UPI00257C56CA|nr:MULTISPECIES: FkbM family methyltransferase [unclassified Microcystis]